MGSSQEALLRKPGRESGVSCRMSSGSALLPPSSLPARDYPARDLRLCSLHPELPRCRGAAGRTKVGYLLRNGAVWVRKFGPVIARRLRQRCPRSSNRWHLDRDGGSDRGRAGVSDHEGEVLDMLIRRRRNTRAALRLMRKLRRKQGFARKLLVTDKLRSYASALRRAQYATIQIGSLRLPLSQHARCGS